MVAIRIIHMLAQIPDPAPKPKQTRKPEPVRRIPGQARLVSRLAPDLEHTRLDPEHTRLDPEHTSQVLEHTSQVLEHTRQDLEHTSQDLEHTSQVLDLEHTRQDLEHTSQVLDPEHTRLDPEHTRQDLEHTRPMITQRARSLWRHLEVSVVPSARAKHRKHTAFLLTVLALLFLGFGCVLFFLEHQSFL